MKNKTFLIFRWLRRWVRRRIYNFWDFLRLVDYGLWRISRREFLAHLSTLVVAAGLLVGLLLRVCWVKIQALVQPPITPDQYIIIGYAADLLQLAIMITLGLVSGLSQKAINWMFLVFFCMSLLAQIGQPDAMGIIGLGPLLLGVFVFPVIRRFGKDLPSETASPLIIPAWARHFTVIFWYLGAVALAVTYSAFSARFDSGWRFVPVPLATLFVVIAVVLESVANIRAMQGKFSILLFRLLYLLSGMFCILANFSDEPSYRGSIFLNLTIVLIMGLFHLLDRTGFKLRDKLREQARQLQGPPKRRKKKTRQSRLKGKRKRRKGPS